MATDFNTAFSGYRGSVAVALHLLELGQQWRKQVSALETRRIERDYDALKHALNTVEHARNWNEFSGGYHTWLRDYLSASTAIWQESMGFISESQSAWSDGMRDALNDWQTAWMNQWHSIAGSTPTAMPMRDWMAAFEQAAAATAGEQEQAVSSTAEASGSRTRGSRGAQHVG